jgi:predicted NUDIX family phosphoesterase
MNIPSTATPIVELTAHDEQILVVKRAHLFSTGSWQGLKRENIGHYLTLITKHKEFHVRSLMESDAAYKQIIPYLIFSYEDRYFLMQRHEKATEARLKSKLTLGIGGHIREEDIKGDDLVTWARREFHEEIDYSGSYTVTPLGIINDDSNPVGQVHVGVVYLLRGDSSAIQVKSELKSGKLMTLEECSQFYDSMEPWTQIVYDTISLNRKSSCCC